MIGRAQTGTGKTAAFLISIFTNLLAKNRQRRQILATPYALILAPTRELVIQITKEAQELCKYANFHVASVYGGVNYHKQLAGITAKPIDVIVATPGRLLDYQRQNALFLDKLEILVIDEADRLLDMGFIPDVRKIIFSTPPKEERQTLFFSATITSEVNHLASQWTRKAFQVDIEPEQVAVDTVKQIVYLTTEKEKYNLLYNTITGQNLKRVMVFTNRRDETRKLTDRLKRNNINCEMLSGEVSQKKRIQTLEAFKKGKIRVLVATDVAGRGIHIDDVSHVINYTLPYDPEDYVHRIGRTGRAGASGISISFACEEGAFYIPDIETFIGQKLDCIYPENELLKPAPRGTHKPEKNLNQPKRKYSGRKRKNYRPGKSQSQKKSAS